MAEAMKYFSTKYTIKMMGARFIPSVCYKLDEIIAPTIEKLVEAGEAHVYSEKVRFVNGVALPIKRVDELGVPKPQNVRTSFQTSAPAASAANNAGKNSGAPNKKGGKRDFD